MKSFLKIIGLIILITTLVYGYNFYTLKVPAESITNVDNRNEGISYNLHYNYFVVPSVLIFDLKNIESNKAPADVFRVFLQTASALKNKKFQRVNLCYKGKIKFHITGEYFLKIGQEFGEQNPIYTIRTFPNNLLDEQGNSIYSEWSGGLLGVLSKQMEDFSDFTSKWYLNELLIETK